MSNAALGHGADGRAVALIIGVSNVPPLTVLAGTKSGVADFSRWAASQGLECTEFTDFAGSSVRVSDVYAEIDQMARTGDVARLFIYFAGHGVVSSGTDLWLLSGAGEDPNAAINVGLSTRLARRSGFPHVAFFADACRSPVGSNTLDVQGQSIFPTRRYSVQPQVDQFYATRYGDPAAEKVPEQVAERAFGIFSRCLMTGLYGQDERAVESVEGGVTERAVLATSLRTYLEQEVPLVSSRETQYVQSPECTPLSQWAPNVLAWVPATSEGLPDRGPTPTAAPAHELDDDADASPRGASEASPRLDGDDSFRLASVRLAEAWGVDPSRMPDPRERGLADDEVAAALRTELTSALRDRYAKTLSRSHFETHAGASVHGAEIVGVVSSDRSEDSFQEGAAWHFRGAGNPATTMLQVVGADSNTTLWTGIATLPGYVASLTVNDAGLEALQYRSIQPTVSAEVDEAVLADALAMDRVGEWTPSSGSALGAEVLLWEDLNPTLTVLAAYYYDRRGDDGEVYGLFERSRARHGWVPFDLALLAEQHVQTPEVFPGFPMMTRGWALLDAAAISPSRGVPLSQGRRALLNSQWTSFTNIDFALVDELTFELAYEF